MRRDRRDDRTRLHSSKFQLSFEWACSAGRMGLVLAGGRFRKVNGLPRKRGRRVVLTHWRKLVAQKCAEALQVHQLFLILFCLSVDPRCWMVYPIIFHPLASVVHLAQWPADFSFLAAAERIARLEHAMGFDFRFNSAPSWPPIPFIPNNMCALDWFTASTAVGETKILGVKSRPWQGEHTAHFDATLLAGIAMFPQSN